MGSGEHGTMRLLRCRRTSDTLQVEPVLRVLMRISPSSSAKPLSGRLACFECFTSFFLCFKEEQILWLPEEKPNFIQQLKLFIQPLHVILNLLLACTSEVERC